MSHMRAGAGGRGGGSGAFAFFFAPALGEAALVAAGGEAASTVGVPADGGLGVSATWALGDRTDGAFGACSGGAFDVSSGAGGTFDVSTTVEEVGFASACAGSSATPSAADANRQAIRTRRVRMEDPFGSERFRFLSEGVNLSVPGEPGAPSVARGAVPRLESVAMRGLYALVDTDSLARRGLDPAAFAEAVLDARPAAIQLRDKRGGAARTLSLLRAIQPLAARAGVPLFANDRPDLALLARCDGVHVGQDDLPVPAVRCLAERAGASLRVGLSTHTPAQLEAALREPLDYVAIGPIFATSSKERPDAVVGVDALASLCAQVERTRPGLPVVAIGGISLERASEVGALCSAVAVIAALLPERDGPGALDEVSARARALHEAITRAAPAEGGAR